MFGGFLGAALDFAGGIFAADRQNAAAESLQQNNINWEREQLQNKHQWEVDDLRKAGLNPILSATTGSSAVSAGVPSASAPEINITKSLNAMQNSALMKKQTEIAQFDADTRRIEALASMKNADMNEAFTPANIANAQAQAEYHQMQSFVASVMLPLQEAMQRAGIRKTEQDIINSIALTEAQDYYYRSTGQANLTTAAANVRQAAAAESRAAAEWENVRINSQNAEVHRETERYWQGEASARTEEAISRTLHEAEKMKGTKFENEKHLFDNPAVHAGGYRGTGLPGFLEAFRGVLGGNVGVGIHR